MDKEKLFGTSFVKQEAKARRKQARRAARAAIAAAKVAEAEKAEQEASWKRKQAFTDLGNRNTAVIEKVKNFTESGSAWKVVHKDYYEQRKTGKIVILGDAPKSELTPAHVAVCLVAYGKTTRSLREQYAQFQFAYLPRDTVAEAISRKENYPLGINMEPKIVVTTEATYLDKQDCWSRVYHSEIPGIGSKVNAEYEDGLLAPRKYKKTLNEVTNRVQTLEQNLDWVLGAAADPDLNPHLQPHPEPVNLAKS